jgi:sugar phosphate isomerase/epimerase
MKFSIREEMAPGSSVTERFENLARMGFAAGEINLSCRRENVEEIKAASKATGLVPNIMQSRELAILDARAPQRQATIEAVKEALTLCAEVGGVGTVMVPLLGNQMRVPDLSPLHTQAELEFELLVTILREQLAPHAEKCGTSVIIEPLNRYEQAWPCTLAQGVDICEAVNSPKVAIMADFFHMAIEEADIAASIRKAGKWIRYVHLADSQRLLPGYGHTQFGEALRAFQEIGYDGFMGFECGIPGDPFMELPKAMRYLEAQLKA